MSERAGTIVIAAVFGVLFALATFGPVSNLIVLPQYYDYLGIGEATPWSLLIVGVALPPLLYVSALLLGSGRPPFARALILTTALATAFALGFGLIAWVAALQPALG